MRRRLTLLAALALMGAVAACENPGGSDERVPAKLSVLSGDLQNDTVGLEVAQPLVVRVLDDRDRPVRNQLVNFVVTAGGGSVFAGSALTNADGEARERWRLGTVAGDTQRVEARAVDPTTGQPLVFAAFRAVGVPDRPATVAAAGGTTRTGAAGTAMADSLGVKVSDQYGNGVPGVAVAFAAGNGGAVSPATAATRTDGTARAQWTLGSAAGAQTASATVAGVPAVGFTATAAPGAVARVVVTPRSIRLNALGASEPLIVGAYDALGNLVSGLPANVQIQNGAVAGFGAIPGGTLGVIALGNGSTVLVATVAGVADTIPVVVRQVAARVATVPSRLSLVPGDTARLSSVAYDARGNVIANAAFSYATSGGAVTVSPSGQVRAVSAPATQTVQVYTDSATTTVPVEVAVPVLAEAVSAGLDHACALGTDGRAYCWGANAAGQVGTGATGGPDACARPSAGGCHAYAVRVSGGQTFAEVSAGARFTCALTPAGAAYCWGDNTHGQLGTGDEAARTAPARAAAGVAFTRIASGGMHACGLTQAGEVYCWGAGGSGQLGDGRSQSSSTPVRVAGGLAFNALSAGYAHTCALTASGAAYCWGEGGQGRLGTGGTTGRAEPAPVLGGHTFTSISAGNESTCAIAAGGAAYCWGNDTDGALARHVDPEPRDRPGPVSGGRLFTSVSAGGTPATAAQAVAHCGVTTNGETHCWGATRPWSGGSGIVPFLQPLAGSLAMQRVEVGGTFRCGIDSRSLVHCWGNNDYGTFGDGTLDSDHYRNSAHVVRLR